MYEYEYRPLLLILAIELSLFGLLWVAFLFKRIYSSFTIKKKKKIGKAISLFIVNSLKDMQNFDIHKIPKVCRHRKELLENLEAFDLRFKDKNWQDFKGAIANELLLPKARKLAKSFFWQRRMFAARCFALVSLEDDEKYLLTLIEDSEVLIQSSAALGLVAIESHDGIRKMIEQMSQNSGFTHYIFEDALQNSTQKVIGMIIELASIQELHFSCLTALNRQSIGFRFPNLEKDLESNDLSTRLLAIKLLSKNPIRNAEERLIAFSKDAHEAIRTVAVVGLGRLGAEGGINRLKEMLLFETSIHVQVEAARSLHQLGQLTALKNESNSQIIDYVVQFG